jgi:hypothetical protein
MNSPLFFPSDAASVPSAFAAPADKIRTLKINALIRRILI